MWPEVKKVFHRHAHPWEKTNCRWSGTDPFCDPEVHMLIFLRPGPNQHRLVWHARAAVVIQIRSLVVIRKLESGIALNPTRLEKSRREESSGRGWICHPSVSGAPGGLGQPAVENKKPLPQTLTTRRTRRTFQPET